MGVIQLLGGGFAETELVVDVSFRSDMLGGRIRRCIFEFEPYTGSLREGSVC